MTVATSSSVASSGIMRILWTKSQTLPTAQGRNSPALDELVDQTMYRGAVIPVFVSWPEMRNTVLERGTLVLRHASAVPTKSQKRVVQAF
jgi:hypothetical protein